ncbi:hypothetical protein B0H12DRAFT_1073061 [Mycena haematopus]|nr:hypothetical protein B0H12DRAFT_1073061 [Mycena haematopus]
MACACAKWLFSGGGVDLGGFTRPRPTFWLASHFVGLASHFVALASAKNNKWLALAAHHYITFPEERVHGISPRSPGWLTSRQLPNIRQIEENLKKSNLQRWLAFVQSSVP